VFGRSESARERTLLRLIEQQQRTIENLADRLMYLSGQTWTPPPVSEADQPLPEAEEPIYSAFHGLPPTEEEEEQTWP
jgi:hypothetical protein